MPDYIALALILTAALYLFWTQKLRMDVTALIVMLALIVPWPHPPDGKWRGILTPGEGFSGFGSAAVIMVAAMFVFGAALARTGATEALGLRLFRACAHSELRLQLAVLGATTLVSMFINDTTVVVIFMPLIITVCKEKNLSPSRYLLLAAYGSLLGGQWTLIGTRSNIIVSDILRQETGAGFGFFDLAPVAAVVFAASVAYFVWHGRRFLPTPGEVEPAEQRLAREYLTEVLVTPQSASIGKTLDQLASERGRGFTVLGVIRGGERMRADGWIKLQADDVLILQGPVPTIGQLLKSPDFKLKEELRINNRTLRSVDLVTVEALLAPRSGYAGRTLDEADFSREYGFSVLGISRHGTTIEDRPTATPLEYGDSLLLLGHVSNVERLARNRNLIVLAQQAFGSLNKRKTLITLGLLLGIIGTAVSGLLSPAVSIPLAALAVILFGCVKLQDLYRVVDWPAVVTAAGMIPFGLAVEKTGAAEKLAHAAATGLHDFGPVALLGVLLVLAIVLTHFIDNSAVGIILAPIAYHVALELGVDPKPFMVGLAVCISACFCTPIAHESTILVMGPGRYQFKHYLQVGAGLAVLTWLLATLVTPLVWPFK